MDCVLLIDKPINWTSFDVVAKVRSVLRQKTGLAKVKVGHAGTLDPLASGLLIVLVGSKTKEQAKFMKLDKTYEAEMCLGQNSSTGDEEGQKIAVSDYQPTSLEIKNVLAGFVGLQNQTPHKYSAIKVNGKRAYDLVRSGKAVDIAPRQVEIYAINKFNYNYPKISFEVSVSSGTYIRSLAEDIGKKLQTGAYLTNLRRTKIGIYSLKDAITMDNLEEFLSN